MSLLEPFLPTPQTVLYLVNVALAVVWSSVAALLAVIVCRRRSAPTCHCLLLLGLVLMLASPALVWMAGGAGLGRFQVSLSQQRDSVDEPEVTPVTLQPTVDARQEPLVTEREAEWEPPYFVEDRTAISPERPAELPISPRAEPDPPVDQVEDSDETELAATMPLWGSIAQGIALIWALGTAISLVWLIRSLMRLAAFCRGLSEHPTEGIQQAANQTAEQAGLVRVPRLFISGQTAMPTTLGLFRPAIVLPVGCADGLPLDQLRAVLLHEMAHVARRDPWVGLAQRLAAALYWWCPPVHWLNRRLTDLREEVCDNYVLRGEGDGASFAEVLVTLAERVTKRSPSGHHCPPR